MGVHGLLTECLEHREECVELVDLVEVARQRSGIEILVDYYCFQQMLLSHFWKSLSSLAQNDYLRILGGEYGSLDVYLSEIVNNLKAVDIYFVMFVDGAKGSSKIGTQQKLETWKYRHHNDLKKLRAILDVCEGRTEITNLAVTNNVRPVLLEIQIFESLRACHIEVVYCPTGEADFVIARNLQLREKAFAVLSNDSDFCMFEDCRFIPNQLFDLKNDLALGDPKLAEKPIRLECGIISSAKVASMFGLDGVESLMEVGIISGNDFTAPHFQGQLKYKLGVKGRASIRDWVKWIKQYRRIENHPAISQEMESNPAFKESVHRSRQFYMLKLPPDADDSRGPLTSFINEAVQKGCIPGNIMAMHHRFYWHRMLVEDCKAGSPCVEVALQPLRSFIYRMILVPNDRQVVEYGRMPFEEFASVFVNATTERRWLPAANIVDPDKVFLNLRTFSWIMNHMESRDFKIKYFDRYGRKNGFICYILRYFLRLNYGYHLHIDLEEFLAIISAVFNLPKREIEFYQHLAIPPNSRCVAMANWLQDVYRHAYSFIGSLLHLTQFFPPPKEFMSGSVFTAVYMLRIHKGDLLHRGFPPVWAERIHQESETVIRENRHIIKHIVEGIIKYNPGF